MNYEVEFIKIFPCYYQYVGYLRIAPLLCSSRNPANIRNPQICYANRYFLMFGGFQVQMSYRASTNDL